MSPPRLILASGSRIRAEILRGAGLAFEARSPGVDEAAIKRRAAAAGASIAEIAERLADAKALAVAADADALVLGSDQILEFRGRAFDKCESLAEARERLLAMQGQTHSLVNAVAIARGGAIVFRHAEKADLRMRKMSGPEIDDYLAAAGEGVLASVGAYEVERLGARLFERIDGDYFTVLGLALFPVLGYLRQAGMLRF